MCVHTSGTPAHRNTNLCTSKFEGCASVSGEGRRSTDTPALIAKGIPRVDGEGRQPWGCAGMRSPALRNADLGLCTLLLGGVGIRSSRTP